MQKTVLKWASDNTREKREVNLLMELQVSNVSAFRSNNAMLTIVSLWAVMLNVTKQEESAKFHFFCQIFTLTHLMNQPYTLQILDNSKIRNPLELPRKIDYDGHETAKWWEMILSPKFCFSTNRPHWAKCRGSPYYIRTMSLITFCRFYWRIT